MDVYNATGMTAASEPTGTLQVAIANASRLLEVDPALAAEQALEILKVFPGHSGAIVLLAAARRRVGDHQAAIATLAPLIRAGGNAAIWFEYGLALGGAGRGCRDAAGGNGGHGGETYGD